jgi:hypothetical protein
METMFIKSISAAERLLQEREMQLKLETKETELKRRFMLSDNEKLIKQIKIHENEICKLNKVIDQLLKYTNLTRRDIINECERDKRIAEIFSAAKIILQREDIWVTFEYGDYWVFHKLDEESDICYCVKTTDGCIDLVEQC